MNGEMKLGRKPSVPKIDRVIDSIHHGAYDESISMIQQALDERKNVLREGVLERVRQVFGPDAEIVSASQSSSNPFERKALEKKQEEIVDDDDDRVMPDPLENLSETEAKMIQGEPHDGSIESRGAIISGLSSSQIGE